MHIKQYVCSNILLKDRLIIRTTSQVVLICISDLRKLSVYGHGVRSFNMRIELMCGIACFQDQWRYTNTKLKCLI